MISEELVMLSRVQFAVTIMYHFIFVPLTLGLCWLMVIMESVYVMTGRVIWKDMTRFWGKLFGINFALGVTTGITMEFQFGTNWAYYSHYVGDIFGAPLALEGLMAFFLESTFVGLFFFGWDRLSKVQHLMTTILLALGTNLSALWILIANGWMQNPVGSQFNWETMRMEMTSFSEIIFNPIAQAKFVHMVSAGYVTGAMFVLSISALYLLRRKNVEFAIRSFQVAAAFGLASILCVLVLGDESGYTTGEAQQTKLAAMEGMWETEPAPAGLNLIAGINEAEKKNDWEVKIPYVLGIIGTRSLDEQIPGLHDIEKRNRERIQNGIPAVVALEKLRNGDTDPATKQALESRIDDLGFGLLLKRHTTDVGAATPEMIEKAVDDSIPKIAPLFWSFRIMVGLGILMLALFAASFYYSLKGTFQNKPWLLRWALYSLPFPWIAIHVGWFLAEYGRQPWTIYGILPTHLSASNFSAANVWGSLAGFVIFYTFLLIVEMYLMIKYVKQGPGSLGTGRYSDDDKSGAAAY